MCPSVVTPLHSRDSHFHNHSIINKLSRALILSDSIRDVSAFVNKIGMCSSAPSLTDSNLDDWYKFFLSSSQDRGVSLDSSHGPCKRKTSRMTDVFTSPTGSVTLPAPEKKIRAWECGCFYSIKVQSSKFIYCRRREIVDQTFLHPVTQHASQKVAVSDDLPLLVKVHTHTPECAYK